MSCSGSAAALFAALGAGAAGGESGGGSISDGTAALNSSTGSCSCSSLDVRLDIFAGPIEEAGIVALGDALASGGGRMTGLSIYGCMRDEGEEDGALLCAEISHGIRHCCGSTSSRVPLLRKLYLYRCSVPSAGAHDIRFSAIGEAVVLPASSFLGDD